MYYAAMRSIASFVPSRCVPNAEFESTLDTSDEWITKRTGIRSRYFASDDEGSSDLGIKAAVPSHRASQSHSQRYRSRYLRDP